MLFSCRGMLPTTKDSPSTSSNPMASPYSRFPALEMFSKGQEQLNKRSMAFKHSNRFGINTPIERSQSLNASRQQSPQIEITLSKANAMLKSQSSPPSPVCKKTDETVQNLSLSMNDEDIPDDDDELTTAAAKIPLDEILGKHGNAYFKDGFRFSCNETTSSVRIRLNQLKS